MIVDTLGLSALSVASPIGPSDLRPVFAGGGRGPLPKHVKSFKDIWLVHLDQGDEQRNGLIDILAWSSDHLPVFSLDIVGSTETSMSVVMNSPRRYGDPRTVAVDLKHHAVVGHFISTANASFITLGQILDNPVNKSDAFGFGTHYTRTARWSGPRIVSFYPGRSLRPQYFDGLWHDRRWPAASMHPMTVASGERVELEASLMSRGSIGAVELTVTRRYHGEIEQALETQAYDLKGKYGSVRYVFQQRLPGRYDVEIVASNKESAYWSFQIVGRCGDGLLVEYEECDDGYDNADAPDACRSNCRLPRCGDGIVDSNEECDEGAENGRNVIHACRADCTSPRCGDGILDLGEACDEGPANSDTDPEAFCGETCAPRTCGDGVQDEGEECDDGAMNDDLAADGCRTNCLLYYCGDGVVDTIEECDDAAQNSDSTPDACRTSCHAPYCGDRVQDSVEECDGSFCCASNCSCDTTIQGCYLDATWGCVLFTGGPG